VALQGSVTKSDHGAEPLCCPALFILEMHVYVTHRTLHTAEDAAEGCEKWVFQLWLCTGIPRRPSINAAAAAARQLAEARRGSGSSTKKQKRPNKKKR